jgi:hypothetical protein
VDERLIALDAKKQKPSQKKRASENEGAKTLKDEEANKDANKERSFKRQKCNALQ